MKPSEETPKRNGAETQQDQQQHLKPDPFFKSTGLQILGIGIEYPPNRLPPDTIERIAQKHYPSSLS